VRQPCAEIGLRIDARYGAEHALGLECPPDDVRVGVVIFEMKKT
jgi:hypothetical protein